MVKLITPVQPEPLPPLTHAYPLLALGSCFVQAMGNRLQRAGFDIQINPHGTLFNPLSIAITVRKALANWLPTPETFVPRGDLYAHTDYHSDLARASIDQALEAIAHANSTLSTQLLRTHWLILTLGTAWVYQTKDGDVVTNCHRQPAHRFTRELLPVDTIAIELGTLLSEIRERNPRLQVLLTVSPVRHLNDGLRENAISKATLLLAVHQLKTSLPYAHYFPAYEILVDELRDYRYYADDLVHPAPLAEEIVWERLQLTWMDRVTRMLAGRHEDLARILAHRPSSTTSPEYADLKEKMLREMEKLEELTPLRSYAAERARLLSS